jgi:immunity protein 52 of polymorphic toxin system
LEHYSIACYWKDRKEDADACTNRLVQCLNGLATCDPAFGEVLVVPRTTRKLPYRVPVDFESIKPFMEKGRNREDVPPRKIIEKLGYSVTFNSDYQKREEQWNIRTVCGLYANTPRLLNSCVVSLPKKGPVVERLLNRTTALCMMRTLISAWDPDWVAAQSYEFQRLIAPDARIPGCLVGWMVYFAARLGKVPDGLPVHSRVELEQGTLLILTEDPISQDRPEHVSTAQAVLSRLQQVGLIPA